MTYQVTAFFAALSIAAQEKFTATIEAVTSRTLANRRIDQAKARVTKAQEEVAFDQALIEALESKRQELPEEAGGVAFKVGDTIRFNAGRVDKVVLVGDVIADLGGRFRVVVNPNDPATMDIKVVFAAQVLEVLPKADDLADQLS